MRLLPVILATLALLAPVQGAPQQVVDVQAVIEQPDGQRVQLQSPVLTVDSNRLFSESRLGQMVQRELEAAGAELQRKNEEIARALEAEEQQLTEQRESLDAEEFRALAAAFDEKAEQIRAERLAELRALNQRLDDERRAFLEAAAPVLEEIMRAAGAVVVLEKRSTFISSNLIDITGAAIARIDAATPEQ